ITVSLFHTFHSGRKSKSSSSSVSIDHDLAEGLVDLEKLQSAMESAVGKLQLDFRDKISTKILPNALDKIKLESQNGKDKFILSQVAQIKLNNGMFVVDMNGSPEFIFNASFSLHTYLDTRIHVIHPSIHVLLTCIVRVTQEYRENLTKIAKAACEQSKQSIRKVRQKGMSDVRKNKKGRSDDDVKTVEKMIQQLTDQFCEDTEVLLEEKTKELLRK
ncbi:unnamed protein product, partial [Porites evermanni]